MYDGARRSAGGTARRGGAEPLQGLIRCGIREVLQELWPSGERNHEELVLQIRGSQKFHHRFAGALDLGLHAATHVEDDSQGQGSIFSGEVSDLLPLLALIELKI